MARYRPRRAHPEPLYKRLQHDRLATRQLSELWRQLVPRPHGCGRFWSLRLAVHCSPRQHSPPHLPVLRRPVSERGAARQATGEHGQVSRLRAVRFRSDRRHNHPRFRQNPGLRGAHVPQDRRLLDHDVAPVAVQQVDGLAHVSGRLLLLQLRGHPHPAHSGHRLGAGGFCACLCARVLELRDLDHSALCQCRVEHECCGADYRGERHFLEMDSERHD